MRLAVLVAPAHGAGVADRLLLVRSLSSHETMNLLHDIVRLLGSELYSTHLLGQMREQLVAPRSWAEGRNTSCEPSRSVEATNASPNWPFWNCRLGFLMMLDDQLEQAGGGDAAAFWQLLARDDRADLAFRR